MANAATNASNTTNVTIRMDADVKAQAEALFAEFGMNLTTAFNVFVRQTLREGRIPFDISVNKPTKETIAAFLEAERLNLRALPYIHFYTVMKTENFRLPF